MRAPSSARLTRVDDRRGHCSMVAAKAISDAPSGSSYSPTPVEHQLIHGGLPHLHRRRRFSSLMSQRPTSSGSPIFALPTAELPLHLACRLASADAGDTGCVAPRDVCPATPSHRESANRCRSISPRHGRSSLARAGGMSIVMTAPVVDYKIHWLKMMSVPESRAIVGRHDGINGRDSRCRSSRRSSRPSPYMSHVTPSTPAAASFFNAK